MPKFKNKDVIESYVMATAKYDFNVYEKRLLYGLVNMAQSELKGIKFANSCCRIDHSLWGTRLITMPISWLLSSGEDKNHLAVKKSVERLQSKIFEYEDDKVWQSFSLIAFVDFKKGSSVFSFEVHPKIWDCILQFSKGYRRFELAIAMSFKSQYAMRFYELLSGETRPLVYAIEDLREMFCLQGKYSLTADFLRKVVKPAKKELDERSEYTFNYHIIKDGKKIVALKFVPVHQPNKRDPELEEHDLQKQVSTSWWLSANFRNYLKSEVGFSEQEIKNNKELFIRAEKYIPDIKYEMNIIRGRALEANARNPKGYIINALRGKIDEYYAHREYMNDLRMIGKKWRIK